MMLRARRAAGPLLRLADAGAVGERTCSCAQPARALFARGFLDFFKVGASVCSLRPPATPCDCSPLESLVIRFSRNVGMNG